MKRKHAARNSCTLPKPQETNGGEKNKDEQGSDVEWEWQGNLSSEIRAGGRGRHDSCCSKVKQKERSTHECYSLCRSVQAGGLRITPPGRYE